MSIYHWKPILKSRGRNRKSRSKTFKTEESAKTWAKNNNVTNYKVIDLKPNSKIHKFKLEFVE